MNITHSFQITTVETNIAMLNQDFFTAEVMEIIRDDLHNVQCFIERSLSAGDSQRLLVKLAEKLNMQVIDMYVALAAAQDAYWIK